MNKKKGYTLVELVVTISLLSVIILIAYPTVVTVFQKSQDNIFLKEALNFYNNVDTSYEADFLKDSVKVNRYCYGPYTNSEYKLHMIPKENYYYDIEIENGKIVRFKVTDSKRTLNLPDGSAKLSKDSFIRSNIVRNSPEIDCSN